MRTRTGCLADLQGCRRQLYRERRALALIRTLLAPGTAGSVGDFMCFFLSNAVDVIRGRGFLAGALSGIESAPIESVSSSGTPSRNGFHCKVLTGFGTYVFPLVRHRRG